jgi:hypothetical protein
MGEFSNEILENLVIMILVGIGLFFLLREVFCWYYKINAMKGIMEDQRKVLIQIRNHLKKDASPDSEKVQE